MSVVFLAPVLHPEQQSPHRLQAGCSTPARFVPAAKFTLMGGVTEATPNAGAARFIASSLFRCGQFTPSSG